MAWNIPGSGSGGSGNSGGSGGNGEGPRRPSPWKPRKGRGGNDFGGIVDRLRGIFDGGGGGNPLRWLLVAVVIMVLFSSFQLVGEQQRGVVLRFGEFARIMQPGPNLKWPWPIESVTKVNATEVRTFSNTVPVLTADENIVTVSLNVQYQVSDAYLYLFGTRNADEVLQQAAQSAVREQVGAANLDTVLGVRGPLGTQAKARLQSSLDTYRTGLMVTELNLPNARPPTEVQPAFDEVNSAQQVRESLVNQAQAYAARIVPEARGEAARLRTAADGYKTAAVARATGDASRFSLLQAEYANAPEVTRKRLWLETVQSVLGKNRKVVGGDGRQLIYVPMAGQTGGAPVQGPAVLPSDVVMPPVESNANRPNERVQRPTSRQEATQ